MNMTCFVTQQCLICQTLVVIVTSSVPIRATVLESTVGWNARIGHPMMIPAWIAPWVNAFDEVESQWNSPIAWHSCLPAQQRAIHPGFCGVRSQSASLPLPPWSSETSIVTTLPHVLMRRPCTILAPCNIVIVSTCKACDHQPQSVTPEL